MIDSKTRWLADVVAAYGDWPIIGMGAGCVFANKDVRRALGVKRKLASALIRDARAKGQIGPCGNGRWKVLM